MSSRDDLPGDPQKDIQKARRAMRTDGMSWSWASAIEGLLLSLTGLVGLGWIVALWFTPTPISGELWLFGGMFAMFCFGAPTALVYFLRRGGVKQIERAIAGR
jgi:hypothetical protein